MGYSYQVYKLKKTQLFRITVNKKAYNKRKSPMHFASGILKA